MRGVTAAFWMAAVGCGLIVPRLSRADRLAAPADVWAQEDGSFRYEVTFRKESGSDRLAGYSWYGSVNVLGGLFVDCHCIATCQVFGPGDSLVFEVQGRLTFVNTPGLVIAGLDLCASTGVTAETVIHDYTSGGPSPPPDTRFWNQPNPFTTQTTFHYRLAHSGPVSLTIHDLAGRIVARVVDETQPAGPQVATWTVPADPGRGVVGVLFAHLTMPGEIRRTRLLVIR